MKLIDQEMIDAIPGAVEKSRAGCEQAADTALAVLFTIGEQFKQFLSFPPIMSNDVELWPMPPPYTLPMGDDIIPVEQSLNRFLQATKINANAFNEAVNTNSPSLGRSIADITPKDSGMIWHQANDLGRLLAAEEGEKNFKTLDLSGNTEYLYTCATTVGESPAPPEPEPEPEPEEEEETAKGAHKKKSTSKVEDL